MGDLLHSLTVLSHAVYQTDMTIRPSCGACLLLAVWFSAMALGIAEELPITENVPMSEFQNRSGEISTYDFDAPPQGMFRSITTAEGFEEQLGRQQTHEIVPIRPTRDFSTQAPAVYIVFSLHQHYQAFKIFGRCWPEGVAAVESGTLVSEDTMFIALEDDSGYLRLSAPAGGWKPGRYKVEIHVGEQINEMSLMGTMRFTVVASNR